MPRGITLAAVLAIISCFPVDAQEPDSMYIGIHQAESEYYSRVFDTNELHTTASPERPVSLKSRQEGEPAFLVYGWHPYWASDTAFLHYDYSVLTHIAYFSYEVDTGTGLYTTLRGWEVTPLIDYAHQQGVRVMLTVTNFGADRNTALLTDTVKQWNLINSLIYQLKMRNGDGVNFDFEAVPASLKANMVSFCRRAAKGIKAELPKAEISVATPAVNWSDAWDLNALADICDYLIMMGYNYYWSSSSTAGPVAPLTGENYNITRSIQEDYLDAGVPAFKLLLGMPWYGYDWPVSSNLRKAGTTGKGSSRTYIATIPMVTANGKTFDNETSVPWMSYRYGTEWRQMWFEDSLSLLLKTDLAKKRGLAGVGIWALSYEAGRPELWNGMKAAIAGTVSSEVIRLLPGTDVSRIISITPNPATDMARISFSIAKPGRMTLTLYDTGGRLVSLITEEMAYPGIRNETINAGTLPPGIYLCVLTTQDGRHTAKFAVAGNN